MRIYLFSLMITAQLCALEPLDKTTAHGFMITVINHANEPLTIDALTRQGRTILPVTSHASVKSVNNQFVVKPGSSLILYVHQQDTLLVHFGSKKYALTVIEKIKHPASLECKISKKRRAHKIKPKNIKIHTDAAA